MKIGLFTDAHYCDKETACMTRRPSLSYQKIKEAMEHFKNSGVDAVICLGDLVDDGGDKEKNIEKINELISLVLSYGLPFYCMMGNHDYQNFTREEFIDYTKNSYPPFSINFGDNTLIFLDANYQEDGSIYAPGHVDWTKSFVPHEQLAQLENILEDEAVTNVYILSHQNLDPEVQWQHIIKNAEDIRRRIKDSSKVKKVIQGHYHPGHDRVIDGIEYHTLPAICENEENHFELLELP